MIANFFNESKPINILSLMILGLLVFVMAYVLHYSGSSISISFPQLLFQFFLFMLLLLFQNFIIRKNDLTFNNSYAWLFFVLMFALFPKAFIHQQLFASNFILFFALRRIYSIRSGLDMKSKLFDSAFWIGIASIIYPWSIVYILLIYIALFVFREFYWNYFLIPVIGYFTPVWLYWVYLLVKDKPDLIYNIWDFQAGMDFRPYNQVSLLLPIAIVLVFILWTVFPTLTNALRAKRKIKNSFRIVLFNLFIAIIVALTAVVKDGSEFIFLFFPFSVLMANYMQLVKEYWFKESLLILFLILTGVVIYFS